MLGNLDSFVLMYKDGSNSGYILVDNGIQVKEIYVPKDVNISWPNRKIYFRRDGTPNPTGGTIKVFDGDVSKEITIVPVSGRVLLKEGQYEK
ncbi:hypothetical protein [Romboutsia sp. 1001713B170207_170306_H8]|uniref:hypothetical protein n=1 Tax=Romboutsia sp. 1001713B170207_170306_H8 TaxID=2787112 RepID=UPI0008210135|nr:hypothetical protein [Romboutsia sp. 1001713B170207_170306_H8]SCH10509.1 Uncharacterised protein [uncultured Clostridium sp.]